MSLALLTPDAWQIIYEAIPQWIIGFLIIGLCASFAYHFLNGIRHLCWDMQIGLEMNQVYRSGKIVIGLFVIIFILLMLAYFS